MVDAVAASALAGDAAGVVEDLRGVNAGGNGAALVDLGHHVLLALDLAVLGNSGVGVVVNVDALAGGGKGRAGAADVLLRARPVGVGADALARLGRARKVGVARVVRDAAARLLDVLVDGWGQHRRVSSRRRRPQAQDAPVAEPPWHEPAVPQLRMYWMERLMSMDVAGRAILMRSPRAEMAPCAQHEPQYWGMCWLRLLVRKPRPPLLPHVKDAGMSATATYSRGSGSARLSRSTPRASSSARDHTCARRARRRQWRGFTNKAFFFWSRHPAAPQPRPSNTKHHTRHRTTHLVEAARGDNRCGRNRGERKDGDGSAHRGKCALARGSSHFRHLGVLVVVLDCCSVEAPDESFPLVYVPFVTGRAAKRLGQTSSTNAVKSSSRLIA